MPMKKYKTKPTEIEALEWKGSNIKEMLEFFPDLVTEEQEDGEVCIIIQTLQGETKAKIGDFIIKGSTDYYPCHPKVFHEKYEVLK
jgi:hypothetical protein